MGSGHRAGSKANPLCRRRYAGLRQAGAGHRLPGRHRDEDDVDPEKGDVAVCQCGLSDEFPFCDGSHRATEDEAPDERYKYVDGERRVVAAIELADGERLVPGDADPATDD